MLENFNVDFGLVIQAPDMLVSVDFVIDTICNNIPACVAKFFATFHITNIENLLFMWLNIFFVASIHSDTKAQCNVDLLGYQWC